MLLLEFSKMLLEQMVKQKMHKLLIYLILPSKTLRLIGVTITWETTQIILLRNCD
jgi:hypothetical protein